MDLAAKNPWPANPVTRGLPPAFRGPTSCDHFCPEEATVGVSIRQAGRRPY